MVTMVPHTVPPRKVSGVVVIRDHISVNFPFQVLKADCRFPTIQLSLKRNSPPKMRLKLRRISTIYYKVGGGRCGPPPWAAYSAPMVVRISFAKAIIKPPNRQRKPWVRWLASWDWMDIPT